MISYSLYGIHKQRWRSPCAAFWLFLITLTYHISAFSEESANPEIRLALLNTIKESNSFDDRFEAEVWLVDMSGRLSVYMKNTDERLELLKIVHFEATKAGLSPEIVLAVIHVESLFDRFAISRVGAQGFMQVMPFWKEEIGRPQDNLMQTETNLRYGCTILKYYLDKEKGDLTKALARYNGSTGKLWYPNRVLNAWRKYWFINNG